MALELNGTTGVSLVQDGVVTAADLASGAITASALPAGSVIQVVSAQLTTAFTTTSNTFVDVTGFEASITPSSASSKVLVILSTSGFHSGLSQGEYRVLRNGTDPAGIAGGRMWTSDGYYGLGTVGDAHTTFLDSPSSTSAQTYKVQIRNRQSETMVIYRDWNGDDGGLHTITLMEIAG